MRSDRAKLFAEAIGTFCLVFAGTGAVVVDQVSGGRVGPLGIALVFGLVVLAMIYAIGHVSGAHMNPAVTIGFYCAGRHSAAELLPYFGAQLTGAVAVDQIGVGARPDRRFLPRLQQPYVRASYSAVMKPAPGIKSNS